MRIPIVSDLQSYRITDRFYSECERIAEECVERTERAAIERNRRARIRRAAIGSYNARIGGEPC